MYALYVENVLVDTFASFLEAVQRLNMLEIVPDARVYIRFRS